jgi:hypothetical protein
MAFIVGPLTPLGPRDVCERFNSSNSLGEAQKYVTDHFKPALAVMFAKNDNDNDNDDSERIDLTADEEAPANVGGHLVGFRLHSKQDKDVDGSEGFYLLRKTNDAWQIDDMFVTSKNNEQLAEPVSVAATYQTIKAESSASTETASTSSTATSKTEHNAGRSWAHWFSSSEGKPVASSEVKSLASEGSHLARNGEKVATTGEKGLAKGIKGIGAIVIAILVGIGKFAKSLFGSGSGTVQVATKTTTDSSSS